MLYKKNYNDFFDIVTSKNLKFVSDNKAGFYHLYARDGIVFYEAFVIKNGGSEQIHYETNNLPKALPSFPDGALQVNTNTALFNKPYTSLTVLTKNECGDPTTIKSSFKGQDVQLVTIVYDSDGDFQSVTVSDL